MDNSKERGEKMETWWGLEEAMDLLATSRRLTLRASRVSSVVSRWPLDLDSSSASSRLFQNRYRHPLRTSNVQPKVIEKKTDLKGIESVSRPLSTITEYEEIKNKLKNVQEENLKLQAVISDLTRVNKRWQNYNSDRQLYVQKLLNTIQDQQEQLNKMGEQRAFPVSEEEAESSTSDNKSRPLDREVSHLLEVERRLKEKVEVLEFQVKANRDDWEAEHNEKNQAVKEKEKIEQRVNSLMNELQELKQSVIEKRLPKDLFMICQECQSKFMYNNSNSGNNEAVDNYPAHSKLYRTALHLPCSSQQWNDRPLPRASPSSMNNDLAIDGDKQNNKEGDRKYNNIKVEEKLMNSGIKEDNNVTGDDCCNDSVCSFKSNFDNNGKVTDIWNIGHSSSASDSIKQDLGASYSRASTVPLVSSPIFREMVTPSNASSASSIALTTVSLPEEPVQYQFSSNGGSTVTSFMQIPIAKSSSAPNSGNSKIPFTYSLDSFNMAPPSAPITIIDDTESCSVTREMKYTTAFNDGVETLTREDIICPSCRAIFPPKIHLEFLDHYKSCQRID